MDKRLLLIINLAVSLVLVAFILHLVGVELVASELAGADLGYVFLSLVALFLMDISMSYRIKILLEGTGEKVSLINILRSHFVGMLLADFTPSRTGYFATAAALRYNYGVPSEKALLAIFGPQIFDFAFKVIVGSLGMLYIVSVFIGPEQGWVLLLGAAIISALVVLMMLILFSARFLALFSFSRKLPVVSRFYEVVLKMQESSHVVVNKTPHIIALILVNWFFRSMSWYFIGKAVGITVNSEFGEFVFYLFLQPLLTMLEFVPSPTIAGLGLSEGGATLLFSLFGIEPAKAATFALLVRFKTTLLHLPAVPEALRIPEGVKI